MVGYLDSESVATYGDKIEGKLRVMAAAYLVMRDGNRCTIRSEFCSQGDAPFEHPESADFDHIVIIKPKPDHRLKNLRLACHSCNSHIQGDQWKQTVEASSTLPREKEKMGSTQPEASSLESAKHDPQRAAWDRIIEDKTVFKKLEELNLMVETSKGSKMYLASDIAECAVSLTIDPVYGKYSSETFMRYIREDRFDKLEVLKDKGRWWARPR